MKNTIHPAVFICFLLAVQCSDKSAENKFEKMINEKPVCFYIFSFETNDKASAIGSHNYHLFDSELVMIINSEDDVINFQNDIRSNEIKNWNHWSSYDSGSKWRLVAITDRNVYVYYMSRVSFDNGSYWLSYEGTQGYLLLKVEKWLHKEAEIASP